MAIIIGCKYVDRIRLAQDVTNCGLCEHRNTSKPFGLQRSRKYLDYLRNYQFLMTKSVIRRMCMCEEHNEILSGYNSV
jgi:hypothetical protein